MTSGSPSVRGSRLPQAVPAWAAAAAVVAGLDFGSPAIDGVAA